jgi:hypothetical protein
LSATEVSALVEYRAEIDLPRFDDIGLRVQDARALLAELERAATAAV